MSSSVNQPLSLIKLSLDEEVVLKCRHHREVRGRLIAFDQHLNMVISNAKETYPVTEIDPETGAEVTRTNTRNFEILYVRGDCIVLFSPLVRT